LKTGTKVRRIGGWLSVALAWHALCWVFGVSLRDFLDRKVPVSHDGKLQEPEDRGVRNISVSCRRPVDKPALENQLLTIIRENKFAMMPFRQICEEKLDRRDIVVRQYFPELSRAISQRYLDNKRLMAESRRAQFCVAIQATARLLHQKGMVPNHKTLRPYLDRAGKLMCDWAIRALREVRIELGYEDQAEQLFLPI
jgi:hypothetical protein